MDEEQNIKPLLESVRMALTGIDYEIVLVDDGSADKTRQQVLEYADERTILAELRKNYGQSTAMTAGIDYSRGKYIALLDGDLQNDPTDIPPMLKLSKKEIKLFQIRRIKWIKIVNTGDLYFSRLFK